MDFDDDDGDIVSAHFILQPCLHKVMHSARDEMKQGAQANRMSHLVRLRDDLAASRERVIWIIRNQINDLLVGQELCGRRASR